MYDRRPRDSGGDAFLDIPLMETVEATVVCFGHGR